MTENLSERAMLNMVHATKAIRSHLEQGQTVLRSKQVPIVHSVANTLEAGFRATYLDLPTGTGKTVIFSQIIDAITQDGHEPKVLIVTDSQHLVEQIDSRFKEHAPNIDVGLYYEHTKQIDKPVIVTTYASYPYFATDHALDFDYVIYDEGHEALSEKRIAYMQNFKNAVWLALSASTAYSNSKTLDNHFELAYRMSVPEAVQDGLISGFRNVLVRSDYVDLDLVKMTRNGNFDLKSLEKAVNIFSRNKSAAEFYKKEIDPYTGLPLLGKRGIINCAGIDHAYDVAKIFQETIPSSTIGGKTACVAIHGRSQDYAEMTQKMRKEILDAHLNGEILLLSNSDLLIQGHDDKKLEITLNLAPTRSWVNVVQRARCLRIDEQNPLKTGLIIDFMDKVSLEKKKGLLYGDVIGCSSVILPEIEQKHSSSQLTAKEFSFKQNTYSIEEEFLSKLDIIWDSEEVNAVISKNILKLETNWKQTDEYSALDLAKMFSASDIYVSALLKRFKRVEESEYWYDPEKEFDPDKLFKLVQRKSSSGVDIICVKKIDIEKFEGIYFSFPRKQKGEMSPADINKSSHQLVKNILDRFEVYAEEGNKWIDPKTNDADGKPISFDILFRRSGSKTIRCLKESDVSRFKEIYFSDVLAQEDDLGIVKITKLLKTDNAKVKNIIDRLIPTEKDPDLWVDPIMPYSDEMPTFKVVIRKSTHGNVRYLKKESFENFRSVYFSLDQKQQDEYSTVDIARMLKINDRHVKSLFDRFVPIDDSRNLWVDPESESGTVFEVTERRSSKNNIQAKRCLKKSNIDKFRMEYYPYDVKQKGDLSAQDIAKRLKTSPAVVNGVLNMHKKHRDKNDLRVDHEVPTNVIEFDIKTRRASSGNIKCIKAEDLERFQSLYFAKLKKQKNEFSCYDLEKVLKVSVDTVVTIFKRLVPVDENKTQWLDPHLENKSDVFQMELRRGNKGDMLCLNENSLDIFAKQYKLQYKDVKPDVQPE